MATKPIVVSHPEQGIAQITLNRPKQHNAFNDDMIKIFAEQLNIIATDSTIKVLILAAMGESFCAGADLNYMKKMANYNEAENYQDAAKLAKLFKQLYSLNKLTIAQIQGAAFGGGIGLIACCDIAIASVSAKFCFSEVKLGLVPAVICPYVCAAIGPRQARRYLLSAESINAEKAEQIGLIHQLSTAQELVYQVNAIAHKILANGSDALVNTKQLIQRISFQQVNNDIIEDTIRSIAKARVSPDAQARMQAFLAK